MSSSIYDPKLSQAGFMDLVAALKSQLNFQDSVLLLSRMPPAQREAALQLGVVAKNYVDVVEGRASPLAVVDSHSKTNNREFTQALTERDKADYMADQLAAQIAAITGHEIGEHTSENDPWANALQASNEWIANCGKLDANNVKVVINGPVGHVVHGGVNRITQTF